RNGRSRTCLDRGPSRRSQVARLLRRYPRARSRVLGSIAKDLQPRTRGQKSDQSTSRAAEEGTFCENKTRLKASTLRKKNSVNWESKSRLSHGNPWRERRGLEPATSGLTRPGQSSTTSTVFQLLPITERAGSAQELEIHVSVRAPKTLSPVRDDLLALRA